MLLVCQAALTTVFLRKCAIRFVRLQLLQVQAAPEYWHLPLPGQLELPCRQAKVVLYSNDGSLTKQERAFGAVPPTVVLAESE